MDKPLVYIDLFAGCGGLSLGLHQAGLQGLFAVEKSPDAFLTLQHNLINQHKHFQWPSWLEQESWDVNEIINKHPNELRALQGKVDLIVGGPPCQGFSVAGRRLETDKRNQLIHSYLEVVELVQPKMIVFENVHGFTMKFSGPENKSKIPYSEIVINKLHELGYDDAEGKMINMVDFGVPQQRKRFIMVASKLGVAEEVFKLLETNSKNFLSQRNLEKKQTSWDAISDLEYKHGTTNCADTKGFQAGITSASQSPLQNYLRKSVTETYTPNSHRFVNHREKTKKVFKKLLADAPKNKSIVGEARANYGIKKRNVVVLDENEPARTITTIPDDFIHYSEPRIMTVRECARIQTFPDWFEFKGAYTTGGERRKKEVPRYSQVGNAIPPLFAEQLGIAIKQVLSS